MPGSPPLPPQQLNIDRCITITNKSVKLKTPMPLYLVLLHILHQDFFSMIFFHVPCFDGNFAWTS